MLGSIKWVLMRLICFTSVIAGALALFLCAFTVMALELDIRYFDGIYSGSMIEFISSSQSYKIAEIAPVSNNQEIEDTIETLYKRDGRDANGSDNLFIRDEERAAIRDTAEDIRSAAREAGNEMRAAVREMREEISKQKPQLRTRIKNAVDAAIDSIME